ncbi:MAG: phage holin family protein [Anaerolineales bacterium]|nr:phage holin family protein [Anaerolineales bacterium]MCX7608565.1 phage holin family protein [Anaerolineales bacterium]MDW8227367.1 phage holin family protein [Anaerolineales bacterium]
MKFILRWAINAAALYVAVVLLPNHIHLQGHPLNVIWLALIFGLVNAILRPPAKALSCLLILLTLGLFTLVINALLFALTGWIGSQFGVGFTLSPPWFWSAFLGSLVTSIVSAVLSFFLRDELNGHSRKKKS